LSTEDETRKLLKIREDLVSRIESLQGEIENLRKAVTEIDGFIVRQGFRQPIPTKRWLIMNEPWWKASLRMARCRASQSTGL